MLVQKIDQVLQSSPPQSIPEQFTKEFLANATLNVYEEALSKFS